jgi:hypothetical protein
MKQSPADPIPAKKSDVQQDILLFNRLSHPVRKMLTLAELQCAKEGLFVVDPSHLFAGLLMLDQSSSNGLRLLGDLGVDVVALESSLRSSGFISAPSTWPPEPVLMSAGSNVAFGPDSHQLLEAASNAAAALGDERIGTEHVVLAFLISSDTYGYRMLNGFGVALGAAKERLDQWLVSGTCQSEPAASAIDMTAPVRFPSLGIVYRIYTWTRLGYMILIFVPFAVTFFVPPRVLPSLDRYLSVMGTSIFLYVIPYVASTYALTALLRARAQQHLLQMPPLKSMNGVAWPFSLCVTFGVLLAAAVLLMFSSFSNRLFVSSGHIVDLPALIGAVLVTMNCLCTVITHWLLTFNIQDVKFVRQTKVS